MIIPTTNGIPDLSGMKANFEKDGERYLMIRMDTGFAPYFSFGISGDGRYKDGWLNEKSLASYTPLPSDHPSTVTLTLDNGETVECEFKRTHTAPDTNKPCMLIDMRKGISGGLCDYVKDHPVVILDNGLIHASGSYNKSNYTPLPPPESARDKAVREKIAERITHAIQRLDNGLELMILKRDIAYEVRNDLKQAIELLKGSEQ